MKKMILMAVAMLSMTTATFAANEENEATASAAAYNMNVDMNSLGSALELTIDQEEAMKDIHTNFSADMMNAAQANKDDRKGLVNKAVEKDLKYVKSVLNNYQYRKYLLLLNTTQIGRASCRERV